MIHVDLGDGIPILFEESKLDGPHVRVTENSHERTTVTEYKFMGRIVHRSVHVQLKEGLGIEALMGRMN